MAEHRRGGGILGAARRRGPSGPEPAEPEPSCCPASRRSEDPMSSRSSVVPPDCSCRRSSSPFCASVCGGFGMVGGHPRDEPVRRCAEGGSARRPGRRGRAGSAPGSRPGGPPVRSSSGPPRPPPAGACRTGRAPRAPVGSERAVDAVAGGPEQGIGGAGRRGRRRGGAIRVGGDRLTGDALAVGPAVVARPRRSSRRAIVLGVRGVGAARGAESATSAAAPAAGAAPSGRAPTAVAAGRRRGRGAGGGRGAVGRPDRLQPAPAVAAPVRGDRRDRRPCGGRPCARRRRGRRGRRTPRPRSAARATSWLRRPACLGLPTSAGLPQVRSGPLHR